MNKARFGPAGNSQSFHDRGYKSSLDVPEYLKEFGLNAFEYQCGRGVNIGFDKAAALGEKCKEEDIQLSIHAPYYISLASLEEEKRINSVDYILQSARAVNAMGGTRIVVHPGGLSGQSRGQATEIACETLKLAMKSLDSEGLGHIRLCMETMGKINQLGTLEEVLAFCLLDERFIPCVDFGHMNARTCGGLKTMADYEVIFTDIKDAIGHERLKELHAHVSKIEYTPAGEKRHLTFSDTQYGPGFEPVMDLCIKYGCAPTIICESDGTQAEDAKTMYDYYKINGGV